MAENDKKKKKKPRKPGRKPKREQSAYKMQAVRPIELSAPLKKQAIEKGLTIQETMFIHNQVDEGLSPENAARAAGYLSSADSYHKIAKRVGAKKHVADAMKEVLDAKGMGVEKIADEVQWGIEQAKQSRIVKDPKTGEIIEFIPNLGVHAKYVQQLQNLNGLSTKGPTVAIQNNLGAQGQNNGQPKSVEPSNPLNIEGLDDGAVAELLDAIRTEISERKLPDIPAEDTQT